MINQVCTERVTVRSEYHRHRHRHRHQPSYWLRQNIYLNFISYISACCQTRMQITPQYFPQQNFICSAHGDVEFHRKFSRLLSSKQHPYTTISIQKYNKVSASGECMEFYSGEFYRITTDYRILSKVFCVYARILISTSFLEIFSKHYRTGDRNGKCLAWNEKKANWCLLCFSFCFICI